MEQFIKHHIPKHKEKVPLDARILMDKVYKPTQDISGSHRRIKVVRSSILQKLHRA